MTVALYARRKSWPLEAVTVRLRHSKIHAADCADCETKEGMLDHIESDLEFAGRLTQALSFYPYFDSEDRFRTFGIAID
jgi:putative redox protein